MVYGSSADLTLRRSYRCEFIALPYCQDSSRLPALLGVCVPRQPSWKLICVNAVLTFAAGLGVVTMPRSARNPPAWSICRSRPRTHAVDAVALAPRIGWFRFAAAYQACQWCRSWRQMAMLGLAGTEHCVHPVSSRAHAFMNYPLAREPIRSRHGGQPRRCAFVLSPGLLCWDGYWCDCPNRPADSLARRCSMPWAVWHLLFALLILCVLDRSALCIVFVATDGYYFSARRLAWFTSCRCQWS